MSKKIWIEQVARTIEVVAEQTVLQSARENAISYPYSCQSGRCGACKSRLLEGEVEHLPSLRFTLTEEEKSQGIFLACRAKPKTDLRVAWLEETSESIAPRVYQAEVVAKKALNHDTWKLILKTEATFDFRPGQFSMLKFSNMEARSYSMASQPGTDLVEFIIRQVSGGRVSTHIARSVQPGERCELEGPYGSAYLRKDITAPILMVAGGSGIAPIKSILEGALRAGLRQRIELYWGVRTEHDKYDESFFQDLEERFANFRFHIAVSDGANTGLWRSGQVANVVFNDWPEFPGRWAAYLAGPPPLVETLTHGLERRGVSTENIHSDPFHFAGDTKEGA